MAAQGDGLSEDILAAGFRYYDEQVLGPSLRSRAKRVLRHAVWTAESLFVLVVPMGILYLLTSTNFDAGRAMRSAVAFAAGLVFLLAVASWNWYRGRYGRPLRRGK